MKYKRKWWSLVAVTLIAAMAIYSWSLAGQIEGQKTRKTTRVGLDSLTETVIATGTIGTDIDIGSGYKYKVLLEKATFQRETE